MSPFPAAAATDNGTGERVPITLHLVDISHCRPCPCLGNKRPGENGRAGDWGTSATL
jgi:hypothetical protein